MSSLFLSITTPVKNSRSSLYSLYSLLIKASLFLPKHSVKMKFATALLFAEAAMAARLTQHRRANHAKRALARKSHPKIASSGPAGISNQTDVEYSENWAGAIVISSDITEVTGVFTVPTPSSPSSRDSDGEYCASVWVGIDGDTCDTAILQTGVDLCSEDGEASFDAWYEWYPDYAYDFDLSVSAGDVIKMTVTATSDSSGKAVLENETTGKTVTKTFSGDVEGDLCRTNAEWIVEDFEEGDSLVSFADFGTVKITDATGKAGGSAINPSSATIIDIEQDDKVLTSCSASDDEVTCTYK
ncbi:Aspergillopepsin-2 [Cytospora mali]|uniref:Aspergillopepsin-2 n=1 Tax=Cytospora mali TaxID=578113 RepID=A0A194VMJ8_CYTMA|nr:Aspergillopepsin-2 [Valsa mali]